MTSKELYKAVWHGYIYSDEAPSFLNELLIDISSRSERTQSIEVSSLLDGVFDDLCSNLVGKHFVPISGGYDSRLILYELRKRFDSHEIQTVSFGTKGQLDFDIGRELAKKLQVNHIELDLDNSNLSVDSLKSQKPFGFSPYLPDYYFNSLVRQVFYESDANNFWSGFLGEATTGAHHFKANDFSEAESVFAQKQLRSKIARKLLGDQFPTYPKPPNEFELTIEHSEWLDLSVRQYNCIAPILFGSDFEWSTFSGIHELKKSKFLLVPFTKKEWCSSFLSVPRREHVEQRLYKKLMLFNNPTIFDIPTKADFGVASHRKNVKRIKKFVYRIQNKLYRELPCLFSEPRFMQNYLPLSNSVFKESLKDIVLDLDVSSFVEAYGLSISNKALIEGIDRSNYDYIKLAADLINFTFHVTEKDKAST